MRTSAARAPTPLWGAAVVVGLFAMIMVAAATQGTPVFAPPRVSEKPAPGEVPTAPAGIIPSAPPTQPVEENPVLTLLLRIVGIVLAVAVAIVVLVVLVRFLRRLWRRRPLRLREAVETGGVALEVAPADLDGVDAPAVRRGIAGALQHLDERGRPDDAIVAAWVGLEESATEAGVARGAAETPAEFTVRVIAHRSAIAGQAELLLGLYERVRFGGHRATEDDRERARRALLRIEEEWR